MNKSCSSKHWLWSVTPVSVPNQGNNYPHSWEKCLIVPPISLVSKTLKIPCSQPTAMCSTDKSLPVWEQPHPRGWEREGNTSRAGKLGTEWRSSQGLGTRKALRAWPAPLWAAHPSPTPLCRAEQSSHAGAVGADPCNNQDTIWGFRQTWLSPQWAAEQSPAEMSVSGAVPGQRWGRTHTWAARAARIPCGSASGRRWWAARPSRRPACLPPWARALGSRTWGKTPQSSRQGTQNTSPLYERGCSL